MMSNINSASLCYRYACKLSGKGNFKLWYIFDESQKDINQETETDVSVNFRQPDKGAPK